MGRPWLADGVVRFVGEPIAAIVSETPSQGADAAELVIVDYEPLEVLVDPEQALASDVLLFPDAGTNVAVAMQLKAEGTTDLFDGCDVVVRQRVVNQRVAPCPMEVRAAAAAWVDGRLVQWASTQAPHSVRQNLAEVYGLDEADVRVIAPDVGGGFGAKGTVVYPEEHLLGLIARHVGRPVRWVETRTENLMGMGHGRGQVQHLELGGRSDGTILAFRNELVQEAGAYPAVGALLPFFTRLMAPGVYDIARVEVSSSSVVTNTTPVVAYRGAGRPEATAAIERMVDLFAAEIDQDPVAVRRRNLVANDRFPFTTPTGAVYDSGDYERALDLAVEKAGYDELRAEQARRRAAGDPRLLGVGLAVYVEITSADARHGVRQRGGHTRRQGQDSGRHLLPRAGPCHLVRHDRVRPSRHRHRRHRAGAG